MKHIFLAALLLAPGLGAQPNTLTQPEIDDGWILLWDGESDFGWEWHGDARWSFRDGVMKASAGANGWLGTTATFGDYVLKLDFRAGADGNSGVFLRSARSGEPHRTGYELQIWNEPLQHDFGTGSLVYYAKVLSTYRWKRKSGGAICRCLKLSQGSGRRSPLAIQ